MVHLGLAMPPTTAAQSHGAPAYTLSMHFRLAILLLSIMATAFAAPPAEVARAPRQPKPLPIDIAVYSDLEIPPAATHHLGREIAQTMHYTGAPWLVRESRQRE